MNNSKILLLMLAFLFFTSTVAIAQYPVIDSEQLRSHLTGKKGGAYRLKDG